MKRVARLPLLTGLVALVAGIGSAIPAQARQDSPAVPVFEDGQALVVAAFEDPDLWIREELWVETEFDSDGDGALDRVHVSVTRQHQTDTEGLKVPVIYGSSPYYSGTAGLAEIFWPVRQEVGETPPERTLGTKFERRTQPYISNGFTRYWVPRGFAVVHSESPGTGLSQGCPTVGGANESLAPKAVVDWLNGRARGFTSVDGTEEVTASWSTGKVGMTGTSYNGTLPLAAATTGVDGLEAVIPDAPNTSYWHYYRANGLVRHPGGYLGEDIDVLYDFIHSQDSDRRDWCNETVRDTEMAEGFDRVTGDYNEFWAGRDYTNQLDDVQAAVFLSHGLSDWNVMPDHSLRIFQALREKGKTARIYLHQGGHGGPPPAEMMNRWFSHYLYGIENGVEDEPKSWIVREDADRDNPTPYADYPHPAAAPVTLFPNAAGHAMGELTTTRTDGQGTVSVVDNVSFGAEALANAEWTEHRIIYQTPQLTDSLHLSGTASVTIRAAADRSAVNLSVYLVSLPWVERYFQRGGEYRRIARGGLVTRGWADLQNHASLTESEPLEPGTFYTMTFDIEPDDQIIPPGQRLALLVMSSDRDFTLWPKPGAELTIDLDGTSITLPVVGGADAYARATNGDMP